MPSALRTRWDRGAQGPRPLCRRLPPAPPAPRCHVRSRAQCGVGCHCWPRGLAPLRVRGPGRGAHTRWGAPGAQPFSGGGPVGEAGAGRAALHLLPPGSGRAPQVSPHLLPRHQSCGAAVTASALASAGSAGGPRGSAANTPRGRPGRGGGGARAGATLGAWPRGLTINESEGPQEHDPGQPESARAEAGRAALEVAPLPRRSLGLRVPSPSLASPQRLPGRRHRWASTAHARGRRESRPAARPRPHLRPGSPAGGEPLTRCSARPQAPQRERVGAWRAAHHPRHPPAHSLPRPPLQGPPGQSPA